MLKINTESQDPRLPDKTMADIPNTVEISVIICSFGCSLKTLTIDKNNIATAMSPKYFDSSCLMVARIQESIG
ncbi:MAG: hypothetical protein ABGY11_04550 [Candidatus Thioglobus sp.]